jgi:hypothetical protein
MREETQELLILSYGLDGPGIESHWGQDFPYLSRPGAHPTSYKMGSKAAGVLRSPSTSSSGEVKERVELCLYSSSGPSWPVLG